MEDNEFEILFRRLYPVLCRYAYLLVKDQAIAEDIVQEQFAYLWENDDRLKIISDEAYLFRAVKNKSINYLQSYSKQNRQELNHINENSFVSNTTSEWMEHNELQQLIHQAMEQLPERCFTIFYLKRFEELSTKEIASKLSISEKTVENQMTIAIRKVAGYLRKYWG